MTCVATKPKGGEHALLALARIPSTVVPGASNVTRWCCNCGAVVIDLDMDGRTQPGAVMTMRFPGLASGEANHG